MNGAFTSETTLSQLTEYPGFRPFGRLLLPLDRDYFRGNTLGDLSLAWYSNIRAETTMEVANYLKTHADQGERIFIDFYSPEEKKTDPTKADTGLFFFRGNKGGKFAVVSPGGGMVYTGSIHDSFPQALELSKRGCNAFALVYRPGWQSGPYDLLRAVDHIIRHAEELGVDDSDYSLWGGSAGARIAAMVGTWGEESGLPRPAAVILQYNGYSEVTGREPPTYSCVGSLDGISSPAVMARRTERLKVRGVPAEIEIFEGLSHGFGLGRGTVAENWLDHAVDFWRRQMKNS
ncbi:MAG: alpha/beta hydrolase [Succinivibrionaceae bacterium]|nr:alpha/beta hydrolase [Succinivibrionaceae bacterium]